MSTRSTNSHSRTEEKQTEGSVGGEKFSQVGTAAFSRAKSAPTKQSNWRKGSKPKRTKEDDEWPEGDASDSEGDFSNTSEVEDVDFDDGTIKSTRWSARLRSGRASDQAPEEKPAKESPRSTRYGARIAFKQASHKRPGPETRSSRSS